MSQLTFPFSPEEFPSRKQLMEERLKHYRQYLLVVEPPVMMQDDVRRMKRHLHHAVGGFEGRASRAHITIGHCIGHVEDEPYFIRSLRTALALTRSFALDFNGFDHFESSGTVFIDPVQKAPLIEIGNSIRPFVKQMNVVSKALVVISHPHVTIGHGIAKEALPKAMDTFSRISYSRSMHVDRIVLLRKMVSQRSKYSRVGEFKLLGSR